MYRLVLYYLIGLVVAAMALGAFGVVPYSPIAIAYSVTVLMAVSWAVNKVFGRLFNVPLNIESAYITGLILALIISPPQTGEYFSIIPFLLLAPAIAMASKFLINIGKKHIFNPAALAVFVTAIVIGQSASWWVGTMAMLPFVIIGGIIMVRKLRQFDLVISFLLAAVITTIVVGSVNGNIGSSLIRAFTGSALLFFAAVMLTEPLTLPPNRDGRIAYGILIGMLFNPQVHFGSLYFSPELSLLVGNVFAYIVSPKKRHVFTIKSVKRASDDIVNFTLEADTQLQFRPGQYMEWTLGHAKTDSRGNRRYFTLASSPTESNAILGVKFYDKPSSYKKRMLQMQPGDTIIGGQLSGDFILPDDPQQKLVFIAGGIGVTPFRSMVKYLLDTGEVRDITLLYSNRTAEEVAYVDVFNQAQSELGVRMVYTLTDKTQVPDWWQGHTDYIDQMFIEQEVPDYHERMFYISGSHSMVTSVRDLLTNMGVARNKIKTDFFPGLA